MRSLLKINLPQVYEMTTFSSGTCGRLQSMKVQRKIRIITKLVSYPRKRVSIFLARVDSRLRGNDKSGILYRNNVKKNLKES
jgi:hypothetical protein